MKKVIGGALYNIKTLRTSAGLTQKAFGELLNIPKRTVENWEGDVNEPPDYLVMLIGYYLEHESYINKALTD